MNFESMSLAELFAASDAIGDQYLSAEEIAVRDAELKEAQSGLAGISPARRRSLRTLAHARLIGRRYRWLTR